MSDGNANKIRVWGIESGRCMRVYWMAEELGLDYEIVPITSRSGQTLSSEFTALNSIQKIPVFGYGPVILSESAAIITYMADRFSLPEGFGAGDTPEIKAKISEWCFFVMTELDAHSLYLIRRHDSLKEVYGEAPEAVASAEQYFKKQIKAATKKMDDSGPYVMGDDFSVADILLTSCLDWATAYDLDVPDEMLRYREVVHQRDAYQKALTITYPNGIPSSMLRSK
jgi:glutathione S-transferase